MTRFLRLIAFTTAAAFAAAACSSAEEPAPSADAPSTASSPAIQSTLHMGKPKEFVPPTYRENGKTVLPLVFPDGTTAELVYPPSLEIAEMGFRPYRAGGLGDPMRAARDFSIFYQGVPKVWRSGGAPLATYETATGSAAEYWDTADSWDPEETLRHLILRIGPWYVAIWDRGTLSELQREKWARNLLGTETKDGFIKLRARRPLRLTRIGEKAGPQVMFEGGDPDRRIKFRRMLLLFPSRCEDYKKESSGFEDVQVINGIGVDRSPGFADWCLEENRMRVHAYGRDRFIDAVIRHLDVRNVTLGS